MTLQAISTVIETTCTQSYSPGPLTAGGESFRPTYWATFSYVGPTTAVGDPSTTVETQEEWRWFDPPEAGFDWFATVGPPTPAGVLLTIETEWVKALKGVADYEAFLDGVTYEHLDLIDTARLTRGHHVFDLVVHTTDGKKLHHQLSFPVVDSVIVDFPERDLTFEFDPSGEGPNGGVLPIIVKNTTSHAIVTQLELLRVQPGWAALIPGESVLEIPAQETRELGLQYELMTTTGIEDDTATFTVAAVPLQPDCSLRECYGVGTGSVALKGNAKVLKALRDVNRDIREGKRPPLTFGDPSMPPEP